MHHHIWGIPIYRSDEFRMVQGAVCECHAFDRFATLRLRNAQHLVSSAEGVSNHAASHEPMTACNQHFHIRLTSCEKHLLYRKTANSEPDYWPII